MNERVRRVLVSVAAVILALAAGNIALPGLAEWRLDSLARSHSLSIAALGLNPALSAFVLVELFALAVPGWRSLRRDPAGRIGLRRTAFRLTFVLALVQAWFIGRWLDTVSIGFGHSAFEDPGLAAELLVTVTLVGAVGFMLALTTLVDRYGLGNGFAVMLVGLAGRDMYQFLMTPRPSGESAFTPILGLEVFLVAAVTVVIFTRDRREPDARVRTPTSGFVPVVWAASFVALLAQLHTMWPAFSSLELSPDEMPYVTASVAIVACVLLSFLFYRNSAGAKTWTRELVPTITYIAFIEGALYLGKSPSLLNDAALVWLVYAVVLAVDLRDEWRFRAAHGAVACAGQVHDVADLGERLAVLHAAGVEVCPRAAQVRKMGYFFAPYVPIDLLVPTAQLEAAAHSLAPKEKENA